MAVAQRPPQTPAQAPAQAASANAKPKKHWLPYVEIDAERSAKLREMARIAGGKSKDFYAALLTPAIDKAIAEFDENRDLVAARAKAAAAKTAAERAQEIATKAAQELAEVEASKK